jgi:hypothetical protein
MPTTRTRRMPVIESPMEEVGTLEKLKIAAAGLYEEDLPGFVIRAAGFTDIGIASPKKIAVVVLKTIGAEIGTHFVRTPSLENFSSLDIRLGRAHDDAFFDNAMSGVNIHRTIKGAGKVILANSGSDNWKARNPTYNRERDGTISATISHDELTEQFAAGFVDPTLVSPNVFSTDLYEGDSVVMRLENGKGPIVHRFDTAVAPREAKSILYIPEELRRY